MNYTEDDTANIVQQYMDNPTRETGNSWVG